MLKNIYSEKIKFFNKNLHQNKTLIIDESNQNYTKGDIFNFSERKIFSFKKKNLILFCGGNDSTSILYYLSFLINQQAVILFDKDCDEEKINYLIEKFKPDYIFKKSNFDVKNYDIINDNKEYFFLKHKFPSVTKINAKLAILLSTSGSLKESKFVKLSYENIFENSLSISKYLNLKSNDLSITTLPLFYSYGLSVIHTHIFFDRKIVCNDYSLLQKEFWYLLEKYKITNISFVPFSYEMLEKIGINRFNFSSLKFLTVAGGKLSEDLTKKFCTVFKKKKINFYAMYGQTEASPRISYIELKRLLKKPNSCGKAIPGGKITINKANKDGIGEIIFQGKNIFKGYAQNRKECLVVKDIKKLNTGDIGYIDKEGDLFILGRKKRDIKVYGIRINLDNLENNLKTENFKIICHKYKNKLAILYESTNFDKKSILIRINKLTALREQNLEFKKIDKFPRLKNDKIDYKRLDKILK